VLDAELDGERIVWLVPTTANDVRASAEVGNDG
jgi:hypothetical protein